MILHQPGSKTARQGFGKHTAAGRLVFQFSGDRIGHLGQQRVMKAAVMISPGTTPAMNNFGTEVSVKVP